jgi:sugar phosphate isomerase/epimerase
MATLDDVDLMSRLPIDFVEILVRQGDGVEDIAALLSRFDGEVILHAPETMEWKGAKVLLDMAGEEGLREASVRRLQDIADAARDFAVPMVLHPGGVRDSIAPADILMERLEQSLSALDGFFWLENMPRHYRWQGQLLHSNLAVVAEQLLQVAGRVDGFVLDTSHAYLSREKDGNKALREMVKALGEGIRHVHLSDAAYPDREGLQLGAGEVDLTLAPRGRGLPILLEVQGGHERAGAGFREALRIIGRKA